MKFKQMKKYILLLVISTTIFLGFNACDQLTDLDLLDDPDKLKDDQANPDFILNQIQLNFSSTIGKFSEKTNTIMRYESMKETYFSEADDKKMNSVWEGVYKNKDYLIFLEELVAEDPTFLLHLAVATVLNVYEFAVLVDYLGDIPYNNIDPLKNFSPPLEEDQVVYANLLEQIDEAIQDFDLIMEENTNNVKDLGKDFFYDNNVLLWKKLANSLKLKMLINIGDSALTDIEALLSDEEALLNEGEDFQFDFSTEEIIVDSRHPLYVSWYTEEGHNDYIGNYFISLLKDAKTEPDPRLRYYLYRQTSGSTDELPCSTSPIHDYCAVGDSYLGRDHGDDSSASSDLLDSRTIYGRYPVGGIFDANVPIPVRVLQRQENIIPSLKGAGIQPILLSSYVQFLKAEAILRLGASGEARFFLEAGIRQSINKVINIEPTITDLTEYGYDDDDDDFQELVKEIITDQEDIDNYVEEVLEEFENTSEQSKLDIVIREYYLAAFGNSIEAYTAYKRTGLPLGIQLPIRGLTAPFPRTFSLPEDAVNRNVNIEQRTITNQVFWDKNPPNFIN